MPALSSTMTEGKIVSWVKEEGDAISKGEAVVVVESDKADMDVESFYDGFLAHICVEDGEMATVGAPIAYVAETEAEIPEAEAKAAAASGGGAAPAPAPAAAPAAEAAPAAPAPAAEAPAPAAPAPAPAPVVNTGRIIATPYAKKLAKKSKIKLETIKGTGLNGRITGEDVGKLALHRRPSLRLRRPLRLLRHHPLNPPRSRYRLRRVLRLRYRPCKKPLRRTCSRPYRFRCLASPCQSARIN